MLGERCAERERERERNKRGCEERVFSWGCFVAKESLRLFDNSHLKIVTFRVSGGR